MRRQSINSYCYLTCINIAHPELFPNAGYFVLSEYIPSHLSSVIQSRGCGIVYLISQLGQPEWAHISRA